MTENHSFPITPPPELLQRLYGLPQMRAIEAAFQAGADQELEACCEEFSLLWDKEEIVTLDDVLKHLRAARRPKPPSLKEQALAALNEIEDRYAGPTIEEELIRRALEQLPNYL
jgi:hypothetical protein